MRSTHSTTPLSPAAPDTASTQAPQLTPTALRRVVLLLAVGSGLAVANIYYAQPLLAPIASAFGVSQGRASLVVTLTQLGYALGIVALMPLGDLLENRALASRTLLVTAVALLAAGLSPDFGVFLGMSVLVGMTSVVAQILIPYTAHLAPEQDRGRYIGTVMSGLLLGIMLARTISSLVAAAWGWRTIFVVSGVLMVILSAVLLRVLPERRPVHNAGYRQLMGSVARLVREEPALRRASACQALMFGTFTCFWTAVPLELIHRHGMSQLGVAVFALVGAGGAAAAPLAGWIGDRGYGVAGRAVALVLASGAMVLADLGQDSIVLLALAGVLLDVAVQTHQVLSQREIYSLRANARARINTVFMTTVFLGGALTSAVTGMLNDSHGWTGVTLLAAVLPPVALAVWGVSSLRLRAHAGR